jgi:hypothetical protein
VVGIDDEVTDRMSDDRRANARISRFVVGYAALAAVWAILEIAWRMRRIRATLS